MQALFINLLMRPLPSLPELYLISWPQLSLQWKSEVFISSGLFLPVRTCRLIEVESWGAFLQVCLGRLPGPVAHQQPKKLSPSPPPPLVFEVVTRTDVVFR